MVSRARWTAVAWQINSRRERLPRSSAVLALSDGLILGSAYVVVSQMLLFFVFSGSGRPADPNRLALPDSGKSTVNCVYSISACDLYLALKSLAIPRRNCIPRMEVTTGYRFGK